MIDVRTTALIAAKDLRQRLRDRSFFLIGVLAPLALAGIFSFVLAPLEEGGFRPRLGLADADGTVVSRGLASALSSLDAEATITVSDDLTAEEARAAVGSGELAAAYLVPRGFGGDVLAGRDAELTILSHPDAPTAASVAEAIGESYLSRLRAAGLAAATLAEQGVRGPRLAPVAARAASLPDPVEIDTAAAEGRQLDPASYYAAAMAVFFVFFTVQAGVTSLLDEEHDGTMTRLLAAPMPRGSILAGKLLASVALGLTSMAVLAVASHLLLGARWGSPLGAAALIVAVVLAAAGVMGLVAGLAGTPEAAGNLQAIVAVILGALGGSFFQIPLGEGLLSLLTRLTPHHWFLRGLQDLVAGGGLGDIAAPIAAMLAFAGALGALGWILLGRRLGR